MRYNFFVEGKTSLLILYVIIKVAKAPYLVGQTQMGWQWKPHC